MHLVSPVNCLKNGTKIAFFMKIVLAVTPIPCYIFTILSFVSENCEVIFDVNNFRRRKLYMIERTYFIFGSHRVKDFENWKKIFESDEKNRQKAGIEVRKIFRSVNDPNDVHFLLECRSADAVYDFFRSDELKKAMKKAGVTSETVIQMLELA
jgi:hypothetical protein